MPHYYFDINDGERFSADNVGADFENNEAARAAAISLLPDIARDELPNGDDREFSVDLKDDNKRVIFHAKLTLHAEWLNGK